IAGPEAFGHNPDLKPYPYDPEQSKALLKQAGFGDGFDIEFEVALVTLGTKTKDIVEAIVQQWSKVGVRARLKIVEAAVFLSDLNNDKLTGMTTFSNFYSGTWDADFEFTEAARVRSGKSLTLDPKAPEMRAQERAETDRAKRKKLLQDGLAYFREQAT